MIAGGIGIWDCPGTLIDIEGKAREKIIPGRVSIGAYEAQIRLNPKTPKNLKIYY